MRFLTFVLYLLLPAAAHAACEGRDLRPEMSPQIREELQQTLTEIAFPEGNHWIARKNDTVLHLVGTLHVNDPRMDAVVERLKPELITADDFYFEVTQTDMTAFEQELRRDPSPVLINTGPTLIDLMSEEEWAALSALLAKRGIPGWMAAKMRPWFLSLMLGFPACVLQSPDGTHGMDARLSELAEAEGIPQHSLEQVDDLMAIFDTHPIEEQARSLVRMAGAFNSGEDQLAMMLNGYFEEKHAEIMNLALLYGFEASGLSREAFNEEWEKFENQLLVQRNNNWMEQILDIEDRTAVIAVGAGHLSDEYGLLNQLEQAGYTLTRAGF